VILGFVGIFLCEIINIFMAINDYYDDEISFFIFSGINARPPEPYYGRLIGHFTEYAHGVKVNFDFLMGFCLEI
jgi:hypothetical protein